MIRPIKMNARIVRLSIRHTCLVEDRQEEHMKAAHSKRHHTPALCRRGGLIDRTSATCFRTGTLAGGVMRGVTHVRRQSGGRFNEEATLASPLKESIRATAGPCGRKPALRSIAESKDGTRSRVLSSTTMARPRLQSDTVNRLLRRDGRTVEQTQSSERSEDITAQVPEPCNGRTVADGYDDQMTRAAVRRQFPADNTNSPPGAISRNRLSKPLAHGDEDTIFRGFTCADMQPAAPEYRSGPPKTLNLPAQTGACPGHARARPVRGPCDGAWKRSGAHQASACDGENRVCSFASGGSAGTSASLELSVRCAKNIHCCI